MSFSSPRFARWAEADLESLTPAMRQYVEQKRESGDALLLFRMGDFYETFYEDAITCSEALGIALTTRNKNDPRPIPLAGIPYHALENYLTKLVDAGYKVAISEQLEDPKQAKGVVKRGVTRIVTAGTLTDETLLSEREDNTLAAFCARGAEVGLAAVELASGRFEVIDVQADNLLDELVRLGPAEVLHDDHQDGPAQRIAEELSQLIRVTVTRRPVEAFSPRRAERALLEHFGVATLEGFGFDAIDASLCAAGCVIDYLRETQKKRVDHISTLKRRMSCDHVRIDRNTWRALEISQTLRGGSRQGSLLHAVDRTVHPAGARTLRRWLSFPLKDEREIVARQDAVSFLVDAPAVRERVRDFLRSMADVERIASRVSLGRANPRDLKALGRALDALPRLVDALQGPTAATLEDLRSRLEGFSELADLIRRGIVDDPPATVREGGLIAEGFHEELDRLHQFTHHGQEWLAEYQRRQIELTKLANLKVAYNRVFGYYIEVSNASKGQVPSHYVRRQTVKNAERYITDELKQFEDQALSARDQAKELEYRLFMEICEKVGRHVRALLRMAEALGRLDGLAGWAELAVERRYVRPEIAEGIPLEIRDGRHPVLDQILLESFVPNDTVMDGAERRVFVITGPNMAGKSTYIRQVALLTLLAQTGSFVPAGAMRWAPADRIFARVGASDELMRGQSTFMVEMSEASNILHNATDKSLVILDELGRGTSTFDGLSLAWAITEHLALKIGCPTLVATHYHELTELAEVITGVKNYNVAVREIHEPDGRGGIVFLHRIVEGGADKSYGIHVAKLAGAPPSVIERSRAILEELQNGFEHASNRPRRREKQTKNDAQLLLFADPADELMKELQRLDPDRLTPTEALRTIKRWKDEFAHG